MELSPIEPKILDHLVSEFSAHGRRACDFLLTAQALLANDPIVGPPRLAEVIAYSLREAMKTIPASQDLEGAVSWRSASRVVTGARRRYETARGMPGQDELGALQDLLVSIDDLEVFHSQEGIHERRLIAIMVARTGSIPVASGTGPIRAYQDLLTRLDTALHGEATTAVVRELWNGCVAILRQLFLPPDLRRLELDRLACITTITPSDIEKLLPLVAAPSHLQYFLGRIESTSWLDELLNAGLLDPPRENGPWPLFAAVERLANVDGTAIVSLLQRLYEAQSSNDVQAFYLADAARSVGEPASSLVLRIVRDHPEATAYIGLRTAATLDPASQLIEDFADILLNQGPWKRAYNAEDLVKILVDGLNEANAARRLQLICWKLKGVEEDEGSRKWLVYRPEGSIGDSHNLRQDDRFAVLLHSFAEMIRRSSRWVSAIDALAIVDPLPEDIRNRARSLVFACHPDHPVSEVLDELLIAIANRDPTGDDLPLLDRLLSDAESPHHLDALVRELGVAPTVGSVAEGLGSGQVERHWLRSFAWASLLPEGSLGGWEAVVTLMCGAYGRPHRESLETRPSVEFGYGESPMSVEELGVLAPLDAAQRISGWRPDPSRRMVGARELARTLEAVIEASPAPWLAAPLAIATELKQPTFISHYLQAVVKSIRNGVLPPTQEILDVVAMVRAKPWGAEPIGHDEFDYDHDWRGAEQASVDIVEALANKDVDLVGRKDEVWGFLEARARDRGERSGILSGARDPLDSAINRPCTQALEAVFAFLAHEFRTGNELREAGLTLLEESLHLEDLDGAEHRAIIAPRLGFLRHVAPQWVERQAPRFFGAEAPPGLGQVTVDLALKWSRPNPWLLENYRSLVRDAALRDVENALDHVLIAMLWDVPGYSVQDNIDFLRQTATQLSRAGEMLGRLLRPGDVSPAHVIHGVQFWKAVIATNDPSALGGFGWLAEVEKISDEIWAAMTLDTLVITGGSIDWSHKVAERAASLAPTTTTLGILNLLVRGRSEEWDRRRSIECAVELIGKADDLGTTPEHGRLRTTLLERGAL